MSEEEKAKRKLVNLASVYDKLEHYKQKWNLATIPEVVRAMVRHEEEREAQK